MENKYTSSYTLNYSKAYVQVDVVVIRNNGFGIAHRGTMTLREWEKLTPEQIADKILGGSGKWETLWLRYTLRT